MAAGKLVSDAIVSALIGERLDSAQAKGAIFDGYPRTRAQAEALDLLLAERGRSLDFRHRAGSRRGSARRADCRTLQLRGLRRQLPRPLQSPARRRPVLDVRLGAIHSPPDDNEETVRRRMAEYRAKTAPILPYYDERGLVKRVDGMASVEQVARQIDAILDA
jgi:adenylate kinase